MQMLVCEFTKGSTVPRNMRRLIALRELTRTERNRVTVEGSVSLSPLSRLSFAVMVSVEERRLEPGEIECPAITHDELLRLWRPTHRVVHGCFHRTKTPTLFLQWHAYERNASFFGRYIENSVTRCWTCSLIHRTGINRFFPMFNLSSGFFNCKKMIYD